MNTEKKLMSLIQSARVLTSTLDLDEVLHELIEQVLHVIDGANASVLFLYDESINKLYARAAVGFDMTHLKHARLAPGEGMSGATFLARKGKMFRSNEETHSYMSNISEVTKQHYTNSLGGYKLPTSAISVPLLSKGTCMGVLTVDIYEKDAKFDEQNLHLLETFAAQATIAIENATLFSRNERTNMIHEALSRAAISQGGIEEITKTLANLIKHGVIVYNEFFDILCTSSKTTKADATRVRHEVETSQKIMDDQISTLSITNDSPLKAVFFPIKSDSYTIGYVTICVHDGLTLDPLDRFAIEQASIIFALEMTRRERTALNDLTQSGYILEQLLHKEWDELSLKQLSQIPAFSTDANHYVIVTMSIQAASSDQTVGNRTQLLRLIYRQVFRHRFQPFILDQFDETTFLFVTPANMSETHVHDELKQIFETLASQANERFLLSLAIGVGRIGGGVASIRSSYRDAKKCMDYIRTNPHTGPFITFYQLGAQRLFLNTKLQELEDFVDDSIGLLLNYDELHSTQLCETLRVYLDNQSTVSLTAKALFVHPNTVKYRLRVIRELLHTESLSGSHAFELQLGLYIHDYLKHSNP